MSLFSSRETSAPRRNPVQGKVSIGVPTDELTFLSPSIIGMTLIKGAAGVPDGMVIKDRHYKMLEQAGVKEVHVFRSKFPERLEYFRLLRKSETDPSSFIADPALNARYGLDAEPRKIPVVLPINDVDRLLVSGMRNYDRQNKCMFCSSQNGMTATRAVVEGGQYTGDYKEIECIPTYPAPAGKKICDFRNSKTKQYKAMPCKANVVFYFNILAKEIDAFDLGSFYKFESSSFETGQNIYQTLESAMDRFKRVDFIPFELEVFTRKKQTPQGMVSKVQIVTLRQPTGLLSQYKNVMGQVQSLISTYVSPEAEIYDPVNQEAADAEFRPEIHVRQLESEGIISVTKSHDETDDRLGRTAILALDALAMRLPAEKYAAYASSRDKVNGKNYKDYMRRLQSLVENVLEEEQEKNFAVNSVSAEDVAIVEE